MDAKQRFFCLNLKGNATFPFFLSSIMIHLNGMKNKTRFLLFIFLTLSTIGYGQNPLSKRIDSALSAIVKPNEPGFVVGIVKNGSFIYKKGFGLADLATNRKNTTNTIFHVASNGKQFTAACIYLLEQQGKLKTTDKLSKYFKGWPKYADSITIDHLIHHQSGIRDFPMLDLLMRGGDFKKNKTIYEILIDQKRLNFAPGSDNSYSNSGYFLLSLIIKKISGQDLTAFANQNIFKPLKMFKTSFSRSQKVAGKANGYIFDKGKYLMSNPTDTVIGHGNIYSTITDWNKWFLEMKNHKILGDSIWRKMLTVISADYEYGGGLEINTVKKRKRIYHGGDIDGYHSNAFYFPNEDCGFIIFSNKDDISIGKIYKLLYSANFNEEQEKDDSKIINKNLNIPFDTSAYIGAYQLKPGHVLYISNSDNRLSINQLWNNANYYILPVTKELFYYPLDTTVTFEFKNFKNNMAQNLEILQNGNSTLAKKINVDLKEYTGKFYNDELQTTYSFIVKGNVLSFLANKEKVTLNPLDVDYFFCNWGEIKFTRDLNNYINGFTYTHERIKNMPFKKVSN